MANWATGLGGFTTGGLAGASAGAPFGPVGSLIGGGLGALGGGLSGLFQEQPKTAQQNTQQIQKFNPQQLSALQQLLQGGLENFNPQAIENKARTQFQTQTIPSIAERFTSMGGGQRSSAFQGALGQAGAGLEQSLAALRSQYGQQALNYGLQPQFENVYQEEAPGFLENLSQSSGPMLLELIKLLSASGTQNKLGG